MVNFDRQRPQDRGQARVRRVEVDRNLEVVRGGKAGDVLARPRPCPHALHDGALVSVPFPDLARNAMEVPVGTKASQVMLCNSEARTSPAGIDRYVPFPRFGHSSETLSIRRFA